MNHIHSKWNDSHPFQDFQHWISLQHQHKALNLGNALSGMHVVERKPNLQQDNIFFFFFCLKTISQTFKQLFENKDRWLRYLSHFSRTYMGMFRKELSLLSDKVKTVTCMRKQQSVYECPINKSITSLERNSEVKSKRLCVSPNLIRKKQINTTQWKDVVKRWTWSILWPITKLNR